VEFATLGIGEPNFQWIDFFGRCVKHIGYNKAAGVKPFVPTGKLVDSVNIYVCLEKYVCLKSLFKIRIKTCRYKKMGRKLYGKAQ
jgi:hypothetical protein